MFRVLIFGDIVAKPGRKALAAVLPELKKQCAPQLTIANAENIAHGVGVTTKTIGEAEMGGKAIIKIVDFHAEATSEKIAFGQYCDGRASIVFGTHTHVPTADAQILPAGTAYVSDVGMTGLKQSVIGANAAMIREMFLTQINHSEMHDTEESGAVIVNAIVVDIDETTGKAHSIERIQKEVVV